MLLKENTKQLEKYIGSGNVVFVGVGNTLHRDDAAGVFLLNRLKSVIKDNPRIQFINAGLSLENYTKNIVNTNSDVIVFLDSVRTNKPAGTVQVFGATEIKETTSSTHDISIKLFVEHLSSQTDARIFLIGIQPQSTEFGEGISKPVREGMKMIESEILRICTN